MHIRQVLRVSRPRFWAYEGATFALIGAMAVSQPARAAFAFAHDWHFWLFALYFFIPANILIYGINDIFDYDTDKNNPKKGTYEELVTPDRQRGLWYWIVLTNIPFLFFVPHTVPLMASFGIFLFCASFYSAWPIRAKARPVIDSLFSAGHYTATGVFGYYLAGGTHFPFLGVLAGVLWCVAMHAFSAVPDIAADTEAKLKTIAMLIGGKPTIMLCAALYLIAGGIALPFVPVAAVLGGAALLIMMHKAYRTTDDAALFTLYTYFPTLNALIGMVVSIELIAKLMM